MAKIKTERQYKAALKKVEKLMDLAIQVERYELKHYPIPSGWATVSSNDVIYYSDSKTKTT